MKTMNREKAENLFYEIKNIQFSIQNLAGCVQNPDFINEENAQKNYDIFYNDYKNIIKKLDKIKDDVYKLHNEIIEIK
jgi:hypothetical protein